MLDRRSGYEYEDLLACGRGELFGPGNAQLPLPPMLMFDRITEISETGGEYGKGLIRAELDVKPDLWFFCTRAKLMSSSVYKLPSGPAEMISYSAKCAPKDG